MRLFTGIDIPEDVVANLNRLLDLLRPTAHLKWTPPYNFHLTTKFIGAWPEDRLRELIDQLRPLGNRSAIGIGVEGVGWFPNARSPKILWTGIKAGPELAGLALDTDHVLSSMGIPKETKPFSPHLTLARVKDVVPLSRLRDEIAHLPSAEFGAFNADRFYLYESKTGPNGSIYSKLAEFPLIAA
ncbi:MAG TPA: RNA 2',3'-cyclic phosphodiesterase [Bryobacteraceae bacterium]|nr:RNA 2',3'-cyclic phosphodiesterase [Bryobacteraceae bacterium]